MTARPIADPTSNTYQAVLRATGRGYAPGDRFNGTWIVFDRFQAGVGWWCRCLYRGDGCKGRFVAKEPPKIKAGLVVSCGCRNAANRKKRKHHRNWTGKTVGWLYVHREIGVTKDGGNVIWLAECRWVNPHVTPETVDFLRARGVLDHLGPCGRLTLVLSNQLAKGPNAKATCGQCGYKRHGDQKKGRDEALEHYATEREWQEGAMALAETYGLPR